MQATFTGGAPGTPTYSWSLIAPVVGSFLNPLNASSQIVRIPGVPANSSASQVVRVTVTDSQGNVSQQNATATANHNSLD